KICIFIKRSGFDINIRPPGGCSEKGNVAVATKPSISILSLTNNSEYNNGKTPLEYIQLVFRAEGTPKRRIYNRSTHGLRFGVLIVGGEDDEDRIL
ncbi:hypothetical protein CLU79DRAFT_706940, partial [Phycomyces nitens]